MQVGDEQKESVPGHEAERKPKKRGEDPGISAPDKTSAESQLLTNNPIKLPQTL